MIKEVMVLYCVRKVTDDLFWIGGNDRRLALFENAFPIERGISYNSYLLMDEQTVLLDTVDRSVSHLFFENLAHALNGRHLDYVIVNHMEPDHCATLGELVLRYPEVKIVCNAKTLEMIHQFFEFDADSRAMLIKEGDTLTVGRHTLSFLMAPMVHWPEVMVTYEKAEKVLFSADGFGKFGALGKEDKEGWACEARRYYFNIVGKYGAQVQALLKKAAGLDIQVICPLHGPVLTENLGYYIGLYDTWSSYRPEASGVTIAYASIHGNTAKAAKAMAEILEKKGAGKVEVFDLSRADMAEAVEAAFQYDKLVLAAATYDGGVFPPMEDFLHHLKSKAYQNRKVALVENGSWGPLAAKTMKSVLEGMKNLTICEKTVTIKSAMKEEDRAGLEQLAEELLA